MKNGEFVTETFNGVNEFLSVIGKRSPNNVFKGEKLSSEKSDYDFTMTSSYAESEELMAKGYKDGLNDLQKCKSLKVNRTTNIRKNIPQTGIVGYAPHVPNAIAGVPQSMIAQQKIEQRAKVLTIVYDIGASANVVGISVAEKEGHRIGWGKYCKAAVRLSCPCRYSTRFLYTQRTCYMQNYSEEPPPTDKSTQNILSAYTPFILSQTRLSVVGNGDRTDKPRFRKRIWQTSVLAS